MNLDEILEVFKTLKHRKPSRKYCPKCASPSLHLSTSWDSWLFPQKYVCDECGYSGPIFMELEKDDGVEVPSPEAPNSTDA